MKWIDIGLGGKFRRLSTVLILSFATIVMARADDPADGSVLAKRLQEINAADLGRHCQFLASDALEGRAAGTRGGQAAAAYLVHELKQLNLTPPAGQKEHRQPFGNQWTNVLAVIPGRHPQRKDEWIVIGAHYDHVGYGTAQNSNGPIGKIHNGADDNASGVSLLLELAAFFSQAEPLLDRSVLIAFWDAEEAGLHGSHHWVTKPTVPLDSIKFAINLDMIGRLREDRVAVMGWRSASSLRRWLVDANAESALHFDFEPEVTSDSDHYSFYAANRPVLHFDTKKHEDYHRPSDDAEKLNLTGLERIGRCVARLVHHAANVPELPAFRSEARKEKIARPDPKARIAPPVRFGVRWNPERKPEDRSLTVAEVIPGTAAAKAGLKKGDRLLKFDRWTGESIEELRTAICVAAKETEIEWQSPEDTTAKSARILLDGDGVRCGISYRRDAALPGCGVINGVMSHSPADRAGLRPGDVLLSIANGLVPEFNDFGSVLPSESGPLELTIDRDGQLQRMTVLLP